MNQSAHYTIESQFGPSSELVSLSTFLERCSGLPVDVGRFSIHEDLSDSEERKRLVGQECSVDELRRALDETINNPFLYAHLVHGHEDSIENILAVASPNGKLKRAGKRKRADTGSSNNSPPLEVSQLQKQFDAITLKSWIYPPGAAAFIRAPRNSDLNAIIKPRPTAVTSGVPSGTALQQDLVLSISTYSRLSWGNHLSRSFQHAVLGSQTLGDLYEAIPCISNEIPSEILKDDFRIHYTEDELSPHKGGVICIEGMAYGDGQSEEDYSDKLLTHLKEMPSSKQIDLQKGCSMHSQRFLDLSLRTNEPYWLLHQGSCEHFIVIDQIRLRHPSDPAEGYPFALHIAPPILDLCQACTRVPATLAISGDIRLGQSPCKMCGPCWKQMGEPRSGGDRVMVVPLRKYQIGW